MIIDPEGLAETPRFCDSFEETLSIIHSSILAL